MYAEIFSVAQIFGWFGSFFYLVSFLAIDSRRTILLWIPGHLFFVVHFWLLGTDVAMFIAVLAAFRDISSLTFKKPVFNRIFVLCLILVWGCTFYVADHWYDYLPAIGNTFLSASSLLKERFLTHRFCAFGHQISWLLFGLIMGSYPILFERSLLLFANASGVLKYSIRKHKGRLP